MWDLLLASEEAKKLAGSILMMKLLWLQTEYMGTRQTRVTLHGAPMDINEDHVGAFFAMYGQVEEVAQMTSKAGIPSGDFIVQVILDRTKFHEISDILFCRGGKIFVVVEGRRLHSYVTWPCHWSHGQTVSRPKTSASASYIKGGCDERQTHQGP